MVEYPVTLSCGITVNNAEELNSALEQELEKYKHQEDTPYHKILNSALWKLGLSSTDETCIGTINLADHRTLDFIQTFQYYRMAWHLASDADIWFRVSLFLDPIFNPRLA